MALDLALAPNAEGTALVLHRADCPDVRKLAAEGVPVLTMYDCARAPKDDITKHSCLDVH